MKWTIAIATTPKRAEKLKELMDVLLPQVDKYAPEIEILIYFNNYERSIGYIRQGLLDEARGEYISHIDDDDMVPDDYCDTIFPLLDGVDYIGFQVQFIDRGKDMLPVYHSLKYTRWYQDETGFYRGITHLNPVKTELARKSSFPLEYTIGEDEAWATGVPAKTEHVIDKVMYIYKHEGDEADAFKYDPDPKEMAKHRQSYKPKPHDTPVRPKFDSLNVRFHPRSTDVTQTNN